MSHLDGDILIFLSAEILSSRWAVDVERDVTFCEEFWSKFENDLPTLLDFVQPRLLKPAPV